MDIRAALKSQYHAAFAMLRGAIENCTDEEWLAGEHPRNFWRIVTHTIFYGHLYLMQTEADFVPWPKNRQTAKDLYGEQPILEPHSKAELLEYLSLIDGMVDEQVDRLDLDTQDCGFSWYSMPKLDHQIVNIRHIQEHAGQLRERLFERDADLRWVGKA